MYSYISSYIIYYYSYIPIDLLRYSSLSTMLKKQMHLSLLDGVSPLFPIPPTFTV
jgi:hypothetical protein